MKAKGLAILGTGSDVGKSTIVAGLCRLLADGGVAVAPFKAQNMALNSYVTHDGGEIGRAQALQAAAARVRPEVAMNPVLLKPTGERASQVIVMGKAVETMSVQEYYTTKDTLLPVVEDALADLRSRFEVVLMEGAGSTAEINLLEHDITNIKLARRAGLPAILVGDIERGGVFAALYGTVALLPKELASGIAGYIINKFRGDPSLLDAGIAQLEAMTGRPFYGVVPYRFETAVDGEDSMDIGVPTLAARGTGLEVAVVQLPRISNYTDIDPLRFEADLSVRWVSHPEQLGHPDLVVIPGTKATVDDLGWLHKSGLAEALERHRSGGGCVLGICGGYQMLGSVIRDAVESAAGEVPGLGWLPVQTEFHSDKVVRQCRGAAMGHEVSGYQIHHGRVRPLDAAQVWVEVDNGNGREPEGACSADGRIFGTTLHGILEGDAFRAAFLSRLASLRERCYSPSPTPYAERRERYIDDLAAALRSHLDLDRLWRLMESDQQA
ncbi:MAG: cobyric acid synthase [Actinomycetota bacterium]|nr:cobyric acid synthase [Actinomycetota bacterium]